MQHERDAAAVGHGVVLPRRGATAHAAAEGRLDLQLHVVRESLDLGPATAAPVDGTQAELSEVGHEDVGEIDQDGASAHHIQGDDRQGHEDRVGVILLDGLVQRRARRRLVVDVATDELDPVVDPAEDEHHLVLPGERKARHADTAGDRDRGEDRLVELVGQELGVEMIPLLVEGHESFDLLRAPGHLVEVAERPGGGSRAASSGGHDSLEVDLPRDPRLLGGEVRRAEARDHDRGPSHTDDATH